jgi:hypothetical protein
VGLIHIFNCREIATMLDTDQVQVQSRIDRIQIRVHVWTCWHCRRLLRQIAWLKKLARQSVEMTSDNPDLEARILHKLTSKS